MRWFVLACLGCLVGCGGDGTFLIVDLRTDLVPGVEFETAEIEVEDSETFETLGRATIRVDRDTPTLEGFRAARIELGKGERTVWATLLDRDRRVVIARVARVSVRGALATTIALTRDCRGVDCESTGSAPQACVAAMCVDARCTEQSLEFCEETCSADTDCSAAASCAEGRCVEGTCYFAGDDSMCGSDEYCNAEDGCAEVMSMSDASVDAAIDAASDAGVDAAVEGGRGTIIVSWASDGVSRFNSTTACFWRADQEPPDTPCVTNIPPSECMSETIGACVVTSCPLDSNRGAAPFPHAGTITVSGLTGGDSVIVPNADGTYPADPGMRQLWSGGDPITFDLGGADVPAYFTTVIAPTQVVITEPDVTPGAFDVDRSSDFTVRWTGGAVGDELGMVLTASDDAAETILACRFEAGDGVAVVPASVLARFPAGSGRFTAGSSRADDATIDAYAVTLSTLVSATGTDGFDAGSDVTFLP